MENIQRIVEENIVWFWGNDPLVEDCFVVSELWHGFKSWCKLNLKESLPNYDEDIIEGVLNISYKKWVSFIELPKWCEGLSFEEWEDKYDYNEEVMSYLHGKCHEWARVNSSKRDLFVVITEYREEMGCLCVMHCCLFRNSHYVDVRGATVSFADVLEAFDYGEYDVEVYHTLGEFNTRLKDLGVV